MSGESRELREQVAEMISRSLDRICGGDRSVDGDRIYCRIDDMSIVLIVADVRKDVRRVVSKTWLS